MAPSTTTVTTSPTKRKGAAVKAREPKGTPMADKETGDGDYEHFFWTYTEEPHRSRRMAIIKAHPEVKAPSPSHSPSPTLSPFRPW